MESIRKVSKKLSKRKLLNNCKLCFRESKQETGTSAIVKIPAAENDPDQCPKCKGKVFSAEMVTARSGHYHYMCFSCTECNRLLDASNVCDGPNNQLYCTSCYGKHFGPQAKLCFEDKSEKTDLIKSGENNIFNQLRGEQAIFFCSWKPGVSQVSRSSL